MKYLLTIFPVLFVLLSCSNDMNPEVEVVEEAPVKIVKEYGLELNDYVVLRDTIKNGDTFGAILDKNGVSQAKIFEVANAFKDTFDVRKIVVGKPYAILKTKDSLRKTQFFVYEKNRVEFAVVDFRDKVQCFTGKKPIKIVEKEASGIITSSLSETMESQRLSPYMTDQLALIYAWTVNFFHLQKGDRFKVVYTEKYINDTISVGLDEIKAAYFKHRGKELYAVNFETDSELGISDYYDEEANNLRRAFLKAPVKFSRISSRYNLKRRIKYYGYKVRPHKGTDFAAPIGTPILATADGVVTKSERRGGNGNYVKIRHNGTYETQYLHMKARKVKVGQYVSQGDVIGWIGMTGNTGGPHVCYRFWKNGKQVDPFKQDLPLSKPLEKKYHDAYFSYMQPLKDQLDCIAF